MLKKKSKKSKSSQKLKSAISTIILAVVVIAIFAYLIVNDGNLTPKGKQGPVAATVNGEEIIQEELDLEYSKLSEQYRAILTKEAILEQIIDKMLLLQKAEEEGIVVSELEIEAQINIIKQQFPTEEIFIQILEQQNFTLDELSVQIEEQLVLNKLLNQTVFSKIEVTEKEISDYYIENKEQFNAVSGQIRAAHILVSSLDEAEEIIVLLKDGTDFGELALARSQDPSATLNKGDLGFFEKGTMVAEFEDVAFRLRAGEISGPIETQFGFHIIKRLPNRVSLDEARESISSVIGNSKQTEAIESFLAELRDKADIHFPEAEEVSGEASDIEVNEDNEEELKEQGDEIVIKKEFTLTSDDVCLEDNKPVIRRYTSSNCVNCEEVGQSFRNAVEDYDVVIKELELDTGDDLYTYEIETSISREEFDVLKKYNSNGAIPAYVFGCKHIRLGNAYDELNLAGEEEAFKEILDELMD